MKSLPFLILLFLFSKTKSQEIHQAPLRIGIFASLYLDSTFTNDSIYNYDETMPKHLLSGLDFTEGVLIALDSIIAKEPNEVQFFDIKSADQKINQLYNNRKFDSLDLIIGAVSGSDYRQLAEIASEKHIPFLSATFPNDGGITNNPFTVLLNPTINVHCQAIVKFVQQTFPTGNIIYVKKIGQQEEKIYNNIFIYNQKQFPKTKTKWSLYTPVDSFNISHINQMIDTSKQNIFICGSLDEGFNIDFFKMATSIKQSNKHFVGMPNWETLKELQQNKHKEKNIYHSASFFNDGSTPYQSFSQKFLDKTKGKASDIAYRGYDASINFINLLLKHRGNFINQLNDHYFQQLIDYNIQPVKSTQSIKPDYFENKRVYIIKKNNGISSNAGKF